MAFTPNMIEGFEGKHKRQAMNVKRTRFTGGTQATMTFDDDNGYHSPTALKMAFAGQTGYIGYHSIGTAGWYQANATYGAACWHVKVTALPGSGQYMHMARWQRSGGTQWNKIRIDENGGMQIAYNDSWNAVMYTLSVDTWYLLVVKHDNTIGFIVDIYDADGDTELATDTHATLKASNMYDLSIGAVYTSTGTMYIDNLVMQCNGGNGIDPYDDYLLTTKYCIDTLHANGEGTDQAQDSGVWTDVDDVGEPDMAATIVTFANSGGNRKYSVTLENSSELSEAIDTILAVQSDVNIREQQGGAAGYVNFIEGANRFKTGEMGWDTNTTNYDTCQVTRLLAPDDSAWTTALLDNLEIGWEIKGTTGDVTYGTALRVGVLYTFAEAVSSTIASKSFF